MWGTRQAGLVAALAASPGPAPLRLRNLKVRDGDRHRFDEPLPKRLPDCTARKRTPPSERPRIAAIARFVGMLYKSAHVQIGMCKSGQVGGRARTARRGARE
jgi:hypothetical protein